MAHNDAPAGAPRRILVVDDDAGFRAFCVAVLEREGFDVLEAEDGRVGFIHAVSYRPDLVLCDITMPVLDGFGLVAALRRTDETRHVPLVFLTGEIQPEVEQRAYDAGAHGFLTKPVVPHALSSYIRDVLRRLAPAATSARTAGRLATASEECA